MIAKQALVAFLIAATSSGGRTRAASCSEAQMTPLADLSSTTNLEDFQSVSTKRRGVYSGDHDFDYSRPYRWSVTIEAAPTFRVSTTPSQAVVVDDASYSYSGNETHTIRGSLVNLNFLDDGTFAAPAAGTAVGMLVLIPPNASKFNSIAIEGSYDDVHVKGDTGLFEGRSSPNIRVTGYGAHVVLQGVKNNATLSSPWQLQVNCHDCRVQVADSDPLVLHQDGGNVEIDGQLAFGSKMYPKRGTLAVHGSIEELNVAETMFQGKSNGCDEPGASIVLKVSGDCEKVKWYKSDDRVDCEEKADLESIELLDLGCTSTFCEDVCAFLPDNKQHSCSSTDVCESAVKDEGRADPEKEANCGGSTSSATTTHTSRGWATIAALGSSMLLAMFV